MSSVHTDFNVEPENGENGVRVQILGKWGQGANLDKMTLGKMGISARGHSIDHPAD
jgi:hypothetical protein